MTAPRRIGVFGGTFDPPHSGHVALAAAAVNALALDLVLFTPAGVAHHKARDVTSATHRVRMCAEVAAAAPFPAEVCTVDVDRGGPTYTVETLTELSARYGADVELFFVAGSDVIASMHTWGPGAQRCLELATFAAAQRPGEVPPVLGGDLTGTVVTFDAAVPDLSSTAIRDLAAVGAPIGDLVGPAVAAYITRRGLYRTPSPAAVTHA